MIFPVYDAPPARDERVLRVRFSADPESVPGARRFVADGLRAWGREALVDDATLCVSELAGNAALHGRGTYIEVFVLDLEHGVRVCVEDDGPAPAGTVAPRTLLPGLPGLPGLPASVGEPGEDVLGAFQDLDELDLAALDALLDAPATGRGLAIVSVLASDWGVEELEAGKRVWAELGTPGARHDDTPVVRAPSGADGGAERADGGAAATDAESAILPEDWVLVRLAGCPVDLSLLQDQHLDELVRELTLMNVNRHNPESAALAQRLEAILRAPAHARTAGRRQTQEARARGDRHVDVEMAMPREFACEVRQLDDAVREADLLCERQELLTLASPPPMRDLRTWMTEQILAQVEHGAAPVSWTDWLASR